VRVGFLVLIFSVAVVGGTIANDSARSVTPTRIIEMPPYGRVSGTFYPVKRTWRLTVESSPDFRGKLYILSEAGFRLWMDKRVIDSLDEVDIHGGVSKIFNPPLRGPYAFLIVNELNETRGVTVRHTQFGWEYDLIVAFSVFACVGGGLMAVGMVGVPWKASKAERSEHIQQ